jgi:hypothetical protein
MDGGRWADDEAGGRVLPASKLVAEPPVTLPKCCYDMLGQAAESTP